MARITSDSFSENTGIEDNSTIINAEGKSSVEVPNAGFIADAEMTRDGQDLMLQAPDGSSVTIENYFLASPAPTIEAPNGATLSPNLVNSFAQSPATYAQNGSMNDESPVGAVEEVNGVAVVVRTDGTSEPITLGTPIYQGDVIETSPTGAVNIAFVDETSMAVSENARMSIDEYSFDPSTESGTTDLSVIRGVFVYTSGLIGRDDPDDVTIETPVGSIGIRGTIIAGNISPSGESSITVIEGAIVVKNALMEQTLSEQFESVKLTGLNSSIKNVGTLDAKDIGDAYGSASSVIPKLFSSINDVSDEESQKQEQQEEKLEAEQAEEKVEAVEEVINTEETSEVDVTEDAVLQTADLENPLETETTKEQTSLNNQVTAESENVEVARDDSQGTRAFRDLQSQNPDTINRFTNQDTGSTKDIGTSSLLNLGDINNDGYNDFLKTNVDPNNLGGNRTVEVLFGDGGGVGSAEVIAEPNINVAFGEEISSVGDFNGDGYLDFAIGDPHFSTTNTGQDGAAYIFSGLDRSVISTTKDINANTGGHHLSAAGDVNGDGKSDLFISSDHIVTGSGKYEAYISYGTTNTTAAKDVTFESQYEFVSNSESDISIGVWDGDAFDDLAISVVDTATNNILTYVISGSETLSGIIDLDTLTPQITTSIPTGTDPQTFKTIAFNDGSDGFDIDGDGVAGGLGLDDFYVGFGENISDLTFVAGQAGAGTLRFQDDLSITTDDVSRPGLGNNDEALHGNTDFNDRFTTGISMTGNSVDQEFILHNDAFRNIDGGNGTDTIVVSGTSAFNLDFSTINFEQIEQIEQIEISSGSSLKLTAENIFNLMKTSDTNDLRIVGGGTLFIDSSSAPNPTPTSADVENALNEIGDGASFVGNVAGADHYEIGNYNLYIDVANTDVV